MRPQDRGSPHHARAEIHWGTEYAETEMTALASKMLVTPTNTKEFVKKFSDLFGSLSRDAKEVSIQAEGPLLSGKMEVHSVRAGLRLFSMNVDVQQDLEIDVEPENDGVLLSLVLDGRSGYTVQRSLGRYDQWEFLPGRNVVGTFRTEKSKWNVFGRSSHRLVELQIASGRAAQLLSEYLESAPGNVHHILARTGGFPLHIQQTLTPQLRMVAHQVLNCPLEGSPRRLFMESKALEILAFQLHALSVSHPGGRAGPTTAERDRLEEARTILEIEFADPPSLITLARRVGLNDFKLKRGFRDIYQTTVFGYVRMLRMEKARILLETGEMNVGEVAAFTGYSCFGHFAEAFRKQFGINPKDFRKLRSG
jgi:AraC-like DNA-binding protein